MLRLAAASLLVLAAPVLGRDHHQAAETVPNLVADPALTPILAAPVRGADTARDRWRHPAETLAFFRVKPGMSVVDYMPAGGWYTKILVPYLGAQGRYIGLIPDGAGANNEGFRSYASGLVGKFSAQWPDWKLRGSPLSVMTSAEIGDTMAGTVDRVLIFREMHNIHRNGLMHQELTRLRGILKDDGLLGIVQHRAKPTASGDFADGSNGYMREKDVIGLVEAHGFELVAASEINANPADTADHPKGVWELPPVLGSKREDLKAIGESDRMTLLFRKRG